MKLRVNILSATREIPREKLILLTNRLVPVAALRGKEGFQIVGKTLSYDIEGDDLWAWVEIEDDVAPAARAAGIVAEMRGRLTLIAVMLTNLSREEIAMLDKGVFSF